VVLSVEVVEADLVRVLRFRGLTGARPSKAAIEAKLGELLADISRRWREIPLP
jgi:hypothetical protein